MDPTGLNIPEKKIEVHRDKTRSEIEAIFESIEANEGVHLGVFVVTRGECIKIDYDISCFSDAEPDERFVDHFNVDSDGKLICFNMLTAKLTNKHNISCLLILKEDYE